MQCPGCSIALPFHFAFASANSKKTCPSCKGVLSPTKESMRKIQKISVLLSFVSGIPLGFVCCYLWLVALQPGLALVVFIASITGVIGSSYIYANSTIRFMHHQPGS